MRYQTFLYLAIVCSVLSLNCYAQPRHLEFQDLRGLPSACSEEKIDYDKLMRRLDMLRTGVYEWDWRLPRGKQWRDSAKQELSCIYEKGLHVELFKKEKTHFPYTMGMLLYELYDDSLQQACKWLWTAEQGGAFNIFKPYLDSCQKHFSLEELLIEPPDLPFPHCGLTKIDSGYTGKCCTAFQITKYSNGQVIKHTEYDYSSAYTYTTKDYQYTHNPDGKWIEIEKHWDTNRKLRLKTKYNKNGKEVNIDYENGLFNREKTVNYPNCNKYLSDSAYTGTCRVDDRMYYYKDGSLIKEEKYESSALQVIESKIKYRLGKKWERITIHYDLNGEKVKYKKHKNGETYYILWFIFKKKLEYIPY